MKLCKNCNHLFGMTCTRDSIPDFVYGLNKEFFREAIHERLYGRCGLEAKFFEGILKDD